MVLSCLFSAPLNARQCRATTVSLTDDAEFSFQHICFLLYFKFILHGQSKREMKSEQIIKIVAGEKERNSSIAKLKLIRLMNQN